jgi:hypothetical protein
MGGKHKNMHKNRKDLPVPRRKPGLQTNAEKNEDSFMCTGHDAEKRT